MIAWNGMNTMKQKNNLVIQRNQFPSPQKRENGKCRKSLTDSVNETEDGRERERIK